MLFEHKCVLAVCVHNHPIMIKIHPVLFLKSTIIMITFSDQAVLRFLAEWGHTDPGPSHDCWLTLVFYHRPAVSPLSCVCQVFPPLVSIFGLFPVLVKCHYELILVQPCLSNYLWFTCVFIVLFVQFDFVWSISREISAAGGGSPKPAGGLPSSRVAAPPGASFAGDHTTGPPLTQCPLDRLWLNARRIAADSSPPDRRWLMPAGRRYP